MKKAIFKSVLITVIVSIVFYFAGVFMYATFSIAEFDPDGRLGLGICWIICELFPLGIIGMEALTNDEKK
jgi:hypothetical protein